MFSFIEKNFNNIGDMIQFIQTMPKIYKRQMEGHTRTHTAGLKWKDS